MTNKDRIKQILNPKYGIITCPICKLQYMPFSLKAEFECPKCDKELLTNDMFLSYLDTYYDYDNEIDLNHIQIEEV